MGFDRDEVKERRALEGAVDELRGGNFGRLFSGEETGNWGQAGKRVIRRVGKKPEGWAWCCHLLADSVRNRVLVFDWGG